MQVRCTGLRKLRLGLIHAPGKHPLQLKPIVLCYPKPLKKFAGPPSSEPCVSTLQIRFYLFCSSRGARKGERWNEGVRRITTATLHPQNLNLFLVIVLPIGGVSLETVQNAAGRTEKYTKMLCPLIVKELKVIAFFLDIDYDNATL